MAYAVKKPKTKCCCSHCGAEIKWIRGTGAPKAVPVEPRRFYFLPEPDGRTFVASDGGTRTGREASDGLVGYVKHDCITIPARRSLTEKELLARQWA